MRENEQKQEAPAPLLREHLAMRVVVSKHPCPWGNGRTETLGCSFQSRGCTLRGTPGELRTVQLRTPRSSCSQVFKYITCLQLVFLPWNRTSRNWPVQNAELSSPPRSLCSQVLTVSILDGRAYACRSFSDRIFSEYLQVEYVKQLFPLQIQCTRIRSQRG